MDEALCANPRVRRCRPGARRGSLFSLPARRNQSKNRCWTPRAIPDEPAVYLDIIRDLSEEGRTTESLIVWDRLVAMNPSIPLTEIYPIINLLRAKKDFTEASRVWRQGVAMAGLNIGRPTRFLSMGRRIRIRTSQLRLQLFYEQKIRTVPSPPGPKRKACRPTIPSG